MKLLNVKYPLYFFASLFILIISGSEILAGSGTIAAVKTEAAIYYFEPITGEISEEFDVDLADWMTGLSAWSFYAFEEAYEAEPEMSEWMVDLSAWNLYTLEEASEADIYLADWMTGLSAWSFPAGEPSGEVEPGMEYWMTDVFEWDINNDYFSATENEPGVELWMIDLESWDIQQKEVNNIIRQKKC